jgi:uncharacterized repeat protein (TIGR01451 family)
MKNKITLLFLATWWFGVFDTDAQIEIPVTLGTAENFAILSKTGITNTQSTFVTGNVAAGAEGTSITGLDPDDINGKIFSTDTTNNASSAFNIALLKSAFHDAEAASADILTRCYDFTEIFDGDLSGQTLIPGVYEWSTDAVINEDIVIHGGADDIWILRVIGTLSVDKNIKIILSGEAQAKNIYWHVTESISIGPYAHMKGNILGSALVIMENGASINGRLLTQNEVILNNNIISSDTGPNLTVTNTADIIFFENIGQEIKYTMVVSNTGDVPLHNILVTDTKTGLNEIINSLEPFESKTFHVSYSITITDFYNGTVINTLTANGLDPEDKNVTASDMETITVLYYMAELVVEKIADRETFSEIGEVINYTIIVSNTGTVNVFDIDIYDPLTGLDTTLVRLNPCHRRSFSASYTTTYEDMCNGSVLNTATAIGIDSKGEFIGSSDDELVMADFYFADMIVEKSTDQLFYEEIGQLIPYTIVVSNTGHSPIIDLVISDPITGFNDTIPSLKQCSSLSYTVNYAVTEQDLINGSIINTAIAIGKGPDDQDVEAADNETITAIIKPSLNIEKIANQHTYSSPGDSITFSITVKNTGNVTIYDIEVIDEPTGGYWTFESLAPGSTIPIETTYIITQQDQDIGIVTNIATVVGLDPFGEEIENSDDETILGISNAALSISKTSQKNNFTTVGEQILYTITIENSGNVTLSDVLVTDDITMDEWLIETMYPGDKESFTTNYTVIQEDLDRGSITNVVNATGKDPKQQTVEDHDEMTINAFKDSGLLLVKTANQETYRTVDEQITYSISLQNTGNISISDITVRDDLTSDIWTLTSLLPGAIETFSTNYTITQKDIDKGNILNIVEATGFDPDGKDISVSDDAEVRAIWETELTIHKTADRQLYSFVGEQITYTIQLQNTGSVSISTIDVSDSLTVENWFVDTLPPGAMETFTTIHIITQEDLNNGSLLNTVIATGKDPLGQDIQISTEEKIRANIETLLDITKTADLKSFSIIGEIITYSIVLTNKSNVTISDIVVTDDLTNERWSIPNLLPNTSETRTTSYLITQEDLDNGSIINLAAATGKDPEGNDVSVSAEEEIVAIADPSLSLQKTADRQVYGEVGETVSYSIVVTNTGNVTISNIDIADNLTGDTWFLESLPPAASRSFVATYTVNQADLDAGKIENLATAAGSDPAGEKIEASDDETILTAELVSSLSVTKNANVPSYFSPGEQITYTIVVTNTGQLTISDVDLTDDLTGDSWVIESIAPGASVSFTANYLITQEDIDRGSVINQAAAAGVDPRGQQVADNDDETITADMNPNISISKTASPSAYSNVGDQILYTIVVQNTGNVTLSNVEVHDDLTGETWFIESLPPGLSMTFTTSITITQQLIDEGLIHNVATVSGKDPADNSISDSTEETVRAVNRQPALDVTKTSERPVYAVAGDVVDYTIVVTNTGNLTIRDINLTDNLTNGTWFIPVLGPGESQIFQTTYQVTKADVDFGQVVNLAQAQGTDPDGNTVSDSDEETAIAIKVPGGLTPDTPYDYMLIIKGLDYYPNNTFRIFNRYGTLVYEASPYRNDWVGVPNRGRILTDADGKVPAGTYFYLLVLEPGQKPFSGYIYLIKN